MRRLNSLIVKEFIQMRRDPLTLAMLMLIPIVQLILFGFAINTDVKHLPTVVFDQSMGQEISFSLPSSQPCNSSPQEAGQRASAMAEDLGKGGHQAPVLPVSANGHSVEVRA